MATVRPIKHKRTSNEIGDDFENIVKDRLSGKRVPGSGGGRFWKLDVRGALRFIISCKATEKDRIVITRDMIREAEIATRGFRGTGDGFRFAVATEVDGIAYITLRLDDWAECITGEAEERLEPTKGVERRRRATRSVLER